MKRYFSTFFAFFCFACLVLCIGSDAMLCTVPDTVYGKVLRLHVLANSDSEEDQALKLQVRDAVLSSAEVLLAPVSDRKEAEGLLRELTGLVGISSLTGIRVLNRYDAEMEDGELFDRAVRTVFSEPQVDTVWVEDAFAAAFSS